MKKTTAPRTEPARMTPGVDGRHKQGPRPALNTGRRPLLKEDRFYDKTDAN